MGRFYKTAKPQFIDFMFKPNLDMHLALAQKEVESDGLKKAFASSAEYNILPTFKAWQSDLDDEVSNLNEAVNPVVQALIEDPNSMQAQQQLRQLTGDAKELYSSGRVGQMARHFREYQDYEKQLLDDISKTKDPVLKGQMNSRLNSYRKYVQDSLGEGFNEDWSRRNLNPYIDAQGDLKENINVENMKQTFDYIGKPVKVIKQGDKLVPISSAQGSIQGGKFVGADGQSYDILESRDDKLKALGLPYQYYRDDLSTEGFMQGMINRIAQQRLHNPGYISMLRDDFEMFGQGRQGEDFSQFVQRRITQEAQQFAAQHPEIIKYSEKRTDYTDKAGLKNLDFIHKKKLQDDKHKKDLDKLKKQGKIVEQDDIFTFTRDEIPEVKYNQEFANWNELRDKINSDAASDAEKHQFALESVKFDPIVEKYGDKILETMGIDPKTYAGLEQGKKMKVTEILSNLFELQQDEYAYTRSENTGFGYQTVSTPYGSKLRSLKRFMEKQSGDVEKFMNENIQQSVSYVSLNENNDSIKNINKYLDFLRDNQVNQTVESSDATNTKGIGMRVDSGGWFVGGKESNNVIGDLKIQTGLSTEEMRKQGILRTSFTLNDNKEIVELTSLNTKRLKNLGIDVEKEGTWDEDVKSFKTVYPNSETSKILQQLPSNPVTNRLRNINTYGNDYLNITHNIGRTEDLKRKRLVEYYDGPEYPLIPIPKLSNLHFKYDVQQDGSIDLDIVNIKNKEKSLDLSLKTVNYPDSSGKLIKQNVKDLLQKGVSLEEILGVTISKMKNNPSIVELNQ